MMKSLFLAIALIISVSVCAQKLNEKDSLTGGQSEYLVQSVLWFQNSPEARALFYQGYQLAKIALDNNLKNAQTSKKKAVVVDIDETVLDNSQFEGKLIHSGKEYSPKLWKEWTDKSMATPLPGVLDFMKFATARNVEIFYISNRRTDELASTTVNLNAHNFPNVDEKHLLFRSEPGGKQARRNLVAKDYEILLFIGDNLADFDEIFDKRGGDCLNDTVDANKDLFGTKYIILPNPMYGDWEKCIYEGKKRQEQSEKKAARYKKVRGF
jgi:5'-nucleotidase (lipoprotein e(P4) family)